MIQVVNLADQSNAQVAEWLVDLADDLRQSDLDEIKAHSGEDPSVALISSVMVSDHAWVILDGDTPIAAFGCAPTGEPGEALVWLLGSPLMDTPANAAGILRLSTRYMDEMHKTYPVLWNHIDDRNKRSMRWLRWCGFELREAVPDFGVERRLFHVFVRQRPSV